MPNSTEKSKSTIYLSLGSNLAPKKFQIQKAIKKLNQNKILIQKISSFYKTQPVGVKKQPWFINICLEAKTNLEPLKLLETCKKIEKQTGRKNRGNWQKREIDIDILFYGEKIIKENNLKIPHPEIPERKFVLIPLNEIAPNFIHPIKQKKISKLLKETKDKNIVITDS
ncbi:2-amino-4-hydroxy-6-hydroxymethyldihydropteridine diphosphokinase [Candidatus Peregrinibacteria bacterium RIFOXYA2_FULL_33_7]|nr:MAG: 2-amino-4-hydroxy-6-hydroxymethyldihydropteridine diphosphokinase [Candidatus Peregrinibacteria bacterium RIFOXYA2_FULL_33_7]